MTSTPLSNEGPVTITRDQWGIGHAVAPDALAAFSAQGWLAASDRLWQMDWDRHRAFGRWAEIAGPSALAEDKLFRRLDMAGRAERNWHLLSADTKQMTEAYASGVNAWLADHGDDLPIEFEDRSFEPWEPWHCVAVYQIRHFFMGTFHRKLWRGTVALRAEPDLVLAMVADVPNDSAMVPGTGGPAIELLADAEEVLRSSRADLAAFSDTDGGSNSWAVHGSQTATGAPLLAGDPHRGIEFPNVYYQCHLACDSFDVIGLSFPGVPGFPHFGHSSDVAWCITHGMADDTDVFIEAGPHPIERTETIHVRGADSVEISCASSASGPVVLGDPASDGPCLSMQWTAWHGADTTLDSLWPMLTATDVDQFEASLRSWVIPVNNVLSADTSGNISFQLRGRVVERAVANRWSPVPGDTEHDWNGLESVSFDDLHHWRNPSRGFLVTANNRTSDDGPFIALDFANAARHDRVVEMLEALDPASTDAAAMQAMHLDTVSLVARKLVPVFVTATPTTDAGRTALDLLADWDGDLTAGSSAATVYSGMRLQWAHEVSSRLGMDGAHLVDPGSPSKVFAGRALFNASQRLLSGEGWRLLHGVEAEGLPAVLGAAVDRVAADLTDRFGPAASEWTWSRAHTMVSPHPLATARSEFSGLHTPADGIPGDGDTVRASSLNPVTGDRASAGSVARYVFDLDNWDRSGWVVPHGVSGERGSGHDLDQRATWLAGELLPMAYTSAAVEAVAVETFTV